MHALPDYCRVASDIWVTRSPSVCFEVVEWHLPDQVCLQFGLRQVVPAAHNTSPTLHGIDMRGRTRTDWTHFHREHIKRWQHRREYLVVGVIDVAVMRYDDLYWYGTSVSHAHWWGIQLIGLLMDTLRLDPRSRLRLVMR